MIRDRCPREKPCCVAWFVLVFCWSQKRFLGSIFTPAEGLMPSVCPRTKNRQFKFSITKRNLFPLTRMAPGSTFLSALELLSWLTIPHNSSTVEEAGLCPRAHHCEDHGAQAPDEGRGSWRRSGRRTGKHRARLCQVFKLGLAKSIHHAQGSYQLKRVLARL